MKTRILRATSMLLLLVPLAASVLQGTAQQLPARQRPPEQQLERDMPELSPQEVDAEARRVAVPRECVRIRPEVQTHDVADGFQPPGSPVTLSPSFTSWLNANNITRKGYDDNRVNAAFADSFKLRSCRVCYATLELGVRHDADNWINDGLTVGAAPFSATAGVRFFSTLVWSPPAPNPKTLTYALPTVPLNQYLMGGPMPPSPFLDVYLQDDTNVDFVKLSVWYY